MPVESKKKLNKSSPAAAHSTTATSKARPSKAKLSFSGGSRGIVALPANVSITEPAKRTLRFYSKDKQLAILHDIQSGETVKSPEKDVFVVKAKSGHRILIQQKEKSKEVLEIFSPSQLSRFKDD